MEKGEEQEIDNKKNDRFGPVSNVCPLPGPLKIIHNSR
jgi:hypothetical protein